MKPRYWKRKPAQEVLAAARKKVSRGCRYFNDAKELLALAQEKLEVEQATLRTRIEALENPTLEDFSKTITRVRFTPDEVVQGGHGESPKAMFDRTLRELEESK